MDERSRQEMISPSGWTVDTLKALMDERELRYLDKFNAAKDAVNVAHENTVKWQESANEWRQAMLDKDRNFITKGAAWGYLVGAVGLILALLELSQRIGR